jgi:hypothetical protein
MLTGITDVMSESQAFILNYEGKAYVKIIEEQNRRKRHGLPSLFFLFYFTIFNEQVYNSRIEL